MKSIFNFFFVAALLAPALGSHAQFVQDKAIRSGEPDDGRIQLMQIEVFDNSTRQGVPANILIKGLNPRITTELKNITDTTLEIKNYRLYTVSCVKPGYMYFAHKFWPDESKVHVEPVPLIPLAVGAKCDILDITFLGDETEIYHKSTPALNELLQWLDVNPNVKICIIGHVNGPDKKIGDNYYMKASEKRAEAVMDYLVDHGVAAERISARGAGNKEMIFPDPQTDWQTDANRRVEIEVTGL